MTHNSRYITADGHSPYIVSSMKWMMVIIDQGMASIWQVHLMMNVREDSRWTEEWDTVTRFSPFITAWVPATTSFLCSRDWKTWKSFLSLASAPLLPSSLCVCALMLNTTVPFHQVLVSATHLKKKKRHSKQDLGYHCPGETLCWQQTFFMEAAQKLETQSAVQQEKSRQIIVLWKQKKE